MTTEALQLLERLCKAAERIADHLTKNTAHPVAGSIPQKPRRNYNEPQPESSHAEGPRPKQAARS